MHVILKLFLLVLLASQPTVTSAFVTPSKKIVKSHKLKFKQKAALWLFKRKLKKAEKRLSNPIITDTTDCSTIIFNSGDKLLVKLLKTTETDVIFKRCSKKKIEISMSKSDIYQIVLSDGLVVFDSKNSPVRSHKAIRTKPNYGYAVLAVLTGLFAILVATLLPGIAIVFGLLAIVLSVISYNRHHPT